MKEEYIKNFIQAGALAKEVRAFGKSLIQPGASYNEVIKKINQKIVDIGGIAAFPPQMALNQIAAHFLVWPGQDIIFSNEIVKLDVGVCYKGAIGDCAVTVDLSGQFHLLIEAVEAALLAAEKSICVGQKISEIGRIIESTILSYQLKPIKNLGGHGLGFYQVHTSPSIPNYPDRSQGKIKPGMTFAIEPFVTNGAGWIDEVGKPSIFSFKQESPIQLPLTKFLLEKIRSFKGLPFAIHDLISADCPLTVVEKELVDMLRLGMIEGYAPLLEQGKGMVAQAENSVLVDHKGKVIITTR